MSDFDFQKLKILVYGDLMLDEYIEGKVERISPEGPEVIFEQESITYRAGGAANVAANLAALGVEVTLIGVIGDDVYGEELTHLMRDVEFFPSINHVRPTTVKSRFTVKGRCLLRVDHEDRDPIETDMGLRTMLTIESLDRDSFHCVIVSDYDKGAVIKPIYEMLLSLDIPVFVDPKKSDASFYRGCDYIKPNRKELTTATGIKEVDRAAAKLQQITGANVLVTLGEDGMELYAKSRPPIMAYEVASEVIDVSGAGDTVIAVFAAAISLGLDEPSSLNLANKAAGIVVKKQGTSVITLAEVEQFR